MFKFIEGLPEDVMAIEATGKITHGDYHNTLIPKAEAMIAKGPQALARFQPHRCGYGSRVAARDG